jgi:hypothetical protein
MKMTPVMYLLLVSAAYVLLALINAFVGFVSATVLGIVWILVLVAPVVIKPLGLRVGLKKWWD